MKETAKGVVSIVLAAAFILSFATTALAAGPGGEKNNPTQRSEQPQNNGNGIKAGFQKKASDENGKEKANGLRAGGLFKMNTEAIAKALAALDEEDRKTLSSSIKAYEKAVAAMKAALADAKESSDELSSCCKDVREALAALLDAAEENDIDLGLRNPLLKLGPLPGNRIGNFFSGAVEKALSALDEDDRKALSSSIKAYEKAVAAMKAAREDAAAGADLSSYREAIRDAFTALLDAAKKAGIDLGLRNALAKDDQIPGNRIGNFFSGTVEKALAALDEGDRKTLSSSIKAYEDAAAAMKAALRDAAAGADLSSYREAIHDAFTALLDAAKKAGIDLGLGVFCKQA